MIFFFADDHFGTHAGRLLYSGLPASLRGQTVFAENEWLRLEDGRWSDACDLLILHCIAGTCGQPMPGAGAARSVQGYLARGGNVLLLHGSSAAFWHWAWWRKIVGLRWVRPDDPDGAPVSSHPRAACRVIPVASGHPLGNVLQSFELQEDEVYINLFDESPVTVLMTTTVGGKSYPQCFETFAPQGGCILSFLPGHLPANVQNPVLQRDFAAMIRYLLLPVHAPIEGN